MFRRGKPQYKINSFLKTHIRPIVKYSVTAKMQSKVLTL